MSEYIPGWILAIFPPIYSYFVARLPARFRPVIVLAAALVIVVGAILVTPLDWPALPDQMFAVFASLSGGYTLAKVAETKATLSGRPVAMILTVMLCSMGVGIVWAQETAATPPIAQSVSMWGNYLLALLGGWLARFVR